MAEHYVPATPETVAWGYFDAARKPVLHVKSGDIVTLDTISGEPADMPPVGDPRFPLLPEHEAILAANIGDRGMGPHFLTGPVFVEGAMPGMVLQVDIISQSLRQPWGWNLIAPLLGTLPEQFPLHRVIHLPIDREAGTFLTPWGKTLPLNPFFGIIGVAPPAAYGRVATQQPREYGGNFDNKEFVPGTTIYLPIWNEGALFSAGDGHAAQGDGEVCLTALEAPLTGSFRLTLRPDLSLKLPRAENDRQLITMGFHEDLDTACRIALSDMLDFIVERSGLARVDAYSLCSLKADMRITQLVDGNKGAHTVIDKSFL